MVRKHVPGRAVCAFNRDIQKSVRMDSGIYSYIMQQKGKNFSDKLENLVIDHARLTGRLEDIM